MALDLFRRTDPDRERYGDRVPPHQKARRPVGRGAVLVAPFEREKGKLQTVLLKPSPIHGTGVFAAIDFKEGDRILEVDDSRLVTEDNPLPAGEHEYHCDWYADGRMVLLAEPARYVNHCCDPNSILRFIDGVRYDIARRDVRTGEEITHDYCIDGFGDTVWQCSCGSEKCRKTIRSGFFHLPRSLQIEYLPYLSDLYRRVHKDEMEALMREAGLA